MRPFHTLVLILGLFVPTPLLAQTETGQGCQAIPIPIAGEYRSPFATATISYNDINPNGNCPGSFVLAGTTNSGQTFNFPFSMPLESFVQLGIFGSIFAPLGSTATWPQLVPELDDSLPYEGGLRVFDAFTMFDEAAPGNPNDPLAALGRFELVQGRAADCICDQVLEEIQTSTSMIALYEDDSFRRLANAYNLQAGSPRSYYLEGDRIVATSGQPREVVGYPDLTYDNLIEGIFDGILEVVNGEIRVVPDENGSLTHATEETDTDGDGLVDGVAGSTSMGSCAVTMPDPQVATNTCTAAVIIRATRVHEGTHSRQCLTDNYVDSGGQLILENGDVLEFDALPDGITESWPQHAPAGLPTSLSNSVTFSRLRNFDPNYAAELELEAYNADLSFLSEFSTRYCSDALVPNAESDQPSQPPVAPIK